MRIAILILIMGISVFAVPGAQAGEIRRIPLADPQLAATGPGRMNLKYLASCALDENTVIVATTRDGVFEFPGAIGIAPHWPWRGLTAEEERWVSACILARTNYFGTRVEISLRSPFPTEAHGLLPDEAEVRDFPLEDGTFFGNIFQGEGEQYVCGSNDTGTRQAQLAAHKRICALPAGRLADGRQMTACGMIYVGACTPGSYTQKGVTYREAISVYLPEKPRSE